MSLLNSSISSTEYYNKVESLISEANNTSNNDSTLKLSLYMEAMDLLEQIENLEKKEYFRNFYEQRKKDISQQIQELQNLYGYQKMRIDDFNQNTGNSYQIASKNNTSTNSNTSLKSNTASPLPLYPTLPDVDDLDQNLIPLITPTVLNSGPLINQTQTQLCPSFSSQIPQEDYLKVNTLDYHSPISSISYPNLYDCSIYLKIYSTEPTIHSQISKTEDKQFSQQDSFSSSGSNNIKKYSNTEKFNKNIMLISTDHVYTGNSKGAKITESCKLENKNSNDFDYLKELIRNINKKNQPLPDENSKHNVSDKIIDIPENLKIESFLGSGAFGTAYLATDNSTHKKFVIKELNDFEGNNEAIVSFFREIEALSKADHPAVLHLYGFSLQISKEKPYPAVVTEYLPGGSLYDIIVGTKTVTMTEKLILLYGICEAMHYLHDRLQIVHRDLKPENIMLNSNNEPIICDFGLSKTMSDEYMNISQTATSSCYIAPELLQGDEYSNKVDVYSYGIIAYELLTGKNAYAEAKNITELRKIVLSGKRPSLDNEKSVHPVFKNLIKSCWNQNEALRPSFYDLARRFRNMEFIVDNCDKVIFRKYLTKCVCKR